MERRDVVFLGELISTGRIPVSCNKEPKSAPGVPAQGLPISTKTSVASKSRKGRSD